MVRMLISAAIYVIANAVGLLVASTLLGSSFAINFQGFIVATLLLSLVLVLVTPLVDKMAQKNLPALRGGVALVTTFVGLLITNAIVDGMSISGAQAWLLGTLLVWVGAVIAGIVLPYFMVKKAVTEHRKD